jgi:hypothetical protein
MVGFIIIGNMNAITYKEIFPYIKSNELWLGCSSFNCGMYFKVPDDYEYADTYKFDRERNGNKVMRVSSICWFTNVPHTKRNTELDLYKKYSADEYPKYDNYDAIEVSKVSEIPMDYEGVMGVPITFLDKYCPTQFEIISSSDFAVEDIEGWQGVSEDFYNLYYEQDNKGQIQIGWSLPHYVENGVAKIPYKRILIRKKKNEEIVEYGKKFLIIGNMNAITYKDIFPYIKNNELWLGLSMNGSNRWFQAPDDYEVKANAAGYKVIDGKKYYFVNGVAWFTNIPHNHRNEPLDLFRKYNETDYPKYDNYDAIEVSRVENIPMDYEGVMGVPITFLYKYCPTQFEIIELCASHGKEVRNIPNETPCINGKWCYARILIRRR